jgi:hypothetical protein
MNTSMVKMDQAWAQATKLVGLDWLDTSYSKPSNQDKLSNEMLLW